MLHDVHGSKKNIDLSFEDVARKSNGSGGLVFREKVWQGCWLRVLESARDIHAFVDVRVLDNASFLGWRHFSISMTQEKSMTFRSRFLIF